jgi:3-phosphoshikimate 1-carboxyvinyltransferase
MTKITVKKSQLDGKIFCPPSKSYSHRAIVISCLSNGTSNLENVLLSRDTIATINCCKMLGMEIDETRLLKELQQQSIDDNKNFSSYNVGNLKITSNGARIGFDTPEDILNAENSGTTIRLLTSLCSFVKEGFTILTGDPSLRKRPMRDLIDSLNQLGVDCVSTNKNNTPPLIVKGGGMRGGEVFVSGKISSQFISSLLLSGIYAKERILIKVLGNQVSKPYIESTISIMKRFGVNVINKPVNDYNNSINNTDSIHKAFDNLSSFSTPSSSNSQKSFVSLSASVPHQNNKAILHDNNNYNRNNLVTEFYDISNDIDYTPTSFKVPGDFSTAALLLSSAILSDGEITIYNLDFSMPQGDSNIINILKKLGANITEDKSNGKLKITGTNSLEGGEFNLRDTPDLLPVLSILSLKCKNAIKITGISHARYKETDRVANISSQLVKFGADVKEEIDALYIKPPLKIKNASLDSFNDHRLFMAFFIASLSTEESQIEGTESVDVSYPGFIDEMKRLGARII